MYFLISPTPNSFAIWGAICIYQVIPKHLAYFFFLIKIAILFLFILIVFSLCMIVQLSYEIKIVSITGMGRFGNKSSWPWVTMWLIRLEQKWRDSMRCSWPSLNIQVLVGILRVFTVAVRSAGQSSVLVPWRRESFCTSIMTMVTGAETVAVTSAY